MFALRQVLTLSLSVGLSGGGVAFAAKVTTRGAEAEVAKVATKVTTRGAETKVAKVDKVAEQLKKMGWGKGAKKDARDLLESNDWNLGVTLEFLTSEPSSSSSSSSSSSGASGSASAAPDQEAGAGATFGSGPWRLVENNAAGACLFESLNDQLAHASGTREQFFTAAQKRELDTADGNGIAVYGQQLREEAVHWMQRAPQDWWVQRLGSIERPEEQAICMFLGNSLFPKAKDGDLEQLAQRREYVEHACKRDEFTNENVLDYMKEPASFGDEPELRIVSALRNVRAQVWHLTEAGAKKLNDLKVAAMNKGTGRLAGVSFWMDEADFVKGGTDHDEHVDGLLGNEASVVEIHVLHLTGHWMSIHPPADWLLLQSALVESEREAKEKSLQVEQDAGAHGEAEVKIVADGGSGAASLFTALVHQGIHSQHNSLFQKSVREQLADPARAARQAEAMRSGVDEKLRRRDNEWWATKVLALLLHWQQHEDEARSFCAFAASDSNNQAGNRRSQNAGAIKRFTKKCATQIAEAADPPRFVTRELVQKYLLFDHGLSHALPVVVEYLNLQRANVWRLNKEGQALLTAFREEEDGSEGGNAGTTYALQRKHLAARPGDVYSPDAANLKKLEGHVNLLLVGDAYMSVLFI